jgi:hypothetical protein
MIYMTENTNTSKLLDEYLSPEQLADELEKSPRTIARWDNLRTGPPKTVIRSRITAARLSGSGCSARSRSRRGHHEKPIGLWLRGAP